MRKTTNQRPKQHRLCEGCIGGADDDVTSREMVGGRESKDVAVRVRTVFFLAFFFRKPFLDVRFVI